MNTVIKVNVIREVVNSCPGNGFAASPAIANWLGGRHVVPNLRVARHAGFGSRDAGKVRRFHTCMAVAAIDSIVFHMVLVTEGNGLFRCDVD